MKTSFRYSVRDDHRANQRSPATLYFVVVDCGPRNVAGPGEAKSKIVKVLLRVAVPELRQTIPTYVLYKLSQCKFV